MKKTLEQKAAEAILQKAATVTIGNFTYEAAPPSIATLILVSEAVSRLPQRKLDRSALVSECLDIAKDCKALGDIAAILVLGARAYNEKHFPEEAQQKRGFLQRRRKEDADVRTHGEILAEEILNTLNPHELYDLIAMLLQRMDLGDFFALTTFLTEVNLLRQTKVETGTTASGQ